MLYNLQKDFHGSNPDGWFSLSDLNSFFGPYDPQYDTSVIKFRHICFHAVNFNF